MKNYLTNKFLIITTLCIISVTYFISNKNKLSTKNHTNKKITAITHKGLRGDERAKNKTNNERKPNSVSHQYNAVKTSGGDVSDRPSGMSGGGYSHSSDNSSDSASGERSNSKSALNKTQRNPAYSFSAAETTVSNPERNESSKINSSNEEMGVSSSNTNNISTTSSSNNTTGGERTDEIVVNIQPKIRGKIPPLKGVIISNNINIVEGAYAAATNCTAPKITLFDIDTMTILADNPITEENLTQTTVFEFEPYTLNLDIKLPTKYLLKTSGCDVNYERIVTSYYTEQNLTPTTTLVSKIIKSSASVDLTQIDGKKVETLIATIDSKVDPTADPETSYTNIDGDASSQVLFEDAFEGESYQVLADAAPDINSLVAPLNLQEKTSAIYSVGAEHWNSSYEIAYEWYVDNNKLSNNNIFTYTPSKNSKRNITIKLLVGKKQSGASLDIDNAFPYHEISYAVTVSDDFPPTAPDFAINSSTTNPTPTENIFLDISTGSDLGSYFEDCESFSNFAITEQNVSPTSSDFIYNCTTETTQVLPYTLLNGDGDIALNIWARDIENQVSPKKTLIINLDKSAPVISITSLPLTFRADTSMPLNWSIYEANQTSANPHTIEFFDGSSWNTLPNVASGDGFLNNQNFSTSYILPNIQVSNAQFRVSLTDSIGNSTQELSSIFAIQKPILAIDLSSHNFGSVANLSTGSAQFFTVTNNGDAATKQCSSVAISGTNASEFSVIVDNCNTQTLAPSSTCTFSIAPTPSTKGGKNATATWTCGLDSISTNLSYTSSNNPPTNPADYSISATEDTPLNFNATTGSDSDGDSITYSIVSTTTHGTLSNCMLNDTDLNCDYSPNLNFNGTDSFTYKLNDGTNDSLTVTTVTINVAPVNDAPTLTATQTINVTEDTPLNFTLNSGSDVDLDTLSYIITQTPSTGTLSCTGGTSTNCTYTPAADDINSYTFQYKVNDGSLDSNIATVTIIITNTNDAPVMVGDQSISTNEDTLVNFTLSGATDIDIPAQTLSYKVITAPTNGVLSNCITTGSYGTDLTCTYTPNANFNGTDSFTYRANDTIADSSTVSTVTITVVPVNDAPTLSTPQSFATNEDTVLNFNLGIGSDIENDTLTYIKLTDPASGTLTCTGGTSRACTYTPALNYNGLVSFTYKVNDGALDSNTATVNITVNAVNDAPTLSTPQAFATNEDTVLNFNLGVGSDIENDTLTYVKLTDPASGTLTCTGGTSRACTYTPALNYNGLVSFTYKVNDGALDSNTATVNITVNAVNDAPTLSTPQAFATNEDTVLNFNLGIGSDIENDTLTYVKLTDPASGTLTCTGGTSRACTYTPALNYNGLVSFTYKVNDGALDSNTATVNITVNPVNDPPVMAANQTFSTDDIVALNFTISNATDIDGDSLVYKIVTAPTHGTISNCIVTGSYGTDLTCTYTANANYNGVDSFTYIANDGTVDALSPATITINVSDKTPPASPAVILATTQYRNVLPQTLTATSCSDVSAIFINEGSQPTSGAAGWQTCSTTAAALSYTLASATEGTHTLKAWSKDAYGNVSTTATNVTVVYDITAPVIAVTNPGLQKGGNVINTAWTLTETNISTSSNHTVSYYNGSTWVVITSTKAATNGPLTNQAFTQSWTVPSLNITTAKIRVSITDLAGNSATSDSTVFTIDSTAPALTIATPAANTYHQSSLTLTGACETGLAITFSGDIPASFDQTCSGGTYSQLVNLTSGDGNKTITVSQTDAAGNITTVSRIFIRDEVAPILTKTSGTSPDFTKNNQPNTWGGTCEGNYTINVTGDQSTSFACSNGSWTWLASAKTVDGTYTYYLVQTDGAGNTSTPPLSLSWTRDATPPVFNATSPVTINASSTVTITNNLNSVTLSGNCEGTNTINITGAATDALSCSSSSWTWTTPTTTVDGSRSFVFTQSDPAGNTSTFTMNHTRDTTGPALTIATNNIINNDNTVTFSGNCETGLTVNVTGSETSSTTCPSGTWTWTSSSQTTDATRSYSFAQSFTVSPFNTTTVSGSWIRETNIPTISLFTTSAANPSRSAFIPVDLTATSQNAAVFITSFCIKSDDSTAPGVVDDCWLEVNSPSVGKALSQTLSLDEFPNLLGWTPKTYAVYVWVKDAAENISSLSASGAGTIGVDKLSHGYAPGIPPTVWDVLAANDPSATLPPTRTQSSVPAGSDLYIRWKASDNLTLPTGAITLYYTPDEINFTQIITGLDNANYGCTGVTLASDEGCYKWTGGSPLNTTYKIQVKVTDAGDISTQLISNPLNSDMIKIIAGNTESGLGGSAQTALFFTRKEGAESDPGTLVVTNDGRFYVADYKRGIITIDPNDGKQKVFIPATGTSSGDGGPAVNATLRYATKINLDYQGRLLILDVDKIRRVDLTQATPSIETIIGGGSDTSDTVANPLNVQIYAHSTNSWTARSVALFAMPNGDIYFQSDYGLSSPGNALRIRIFKAATGQVISKYFTGTGDTYDSGVDITKCRMYHPGIQFDTGTSQISALSAVVYHHYSYTECDNDPVATDGERYTMANFDPATFVAITPNQDTWAPYYRYFNQTKMDGFLYRTISREYVNRINFDGTYTRLIGSGTRGYCEDGTLATSCNMDIQDFYITPDGKVYVLEGGQIRTIDESGNMVTLFGQRRSYGDGVNALNARFDYINAAKRLNNGKYIVGDSSSYYFKEFTTEGDINIIGGNGNYKSVQSTAIAATAQGFYDAGWMAVDPATGDIYARMEYYGRVGKLNRATGMWEQVIGCGATDYWNSDNLVGTDSKCNGYQTQGLVLGFDGQNLLLSRMRHNTVDNHYEDFMLKLYDSSDSFRQSHLAGTNGTDTYTGGYNGICASGSTAATCKVPYYSYMGFPYWDSANSRWLMVQNRESTDTGRNIFSVVKGGNITQVARLARRALRGYTYLKVGATEYMYYCYDNGRIYKHNITTNTDEGQLTWPVTNLNCTGMTMDYNPTNNSLIFPFEQNGLYGVAEYFLP